VNPRKPKLSIGTGVLMKLSPVESVKVKVDGVSAKDP
jgi:hypothetical protein